MVVACLVSDYELKGKINVELILQVTSRAQSLCVIIPKKMTSTYGVISGDRIKVSIAEFYRKKHE